MARSGTCLAVQETDIAVHGRCWPLMAGPGKVRQSQGQGSAPRGQARLTCRPLFVDEFVLRSTAVHEHSADGTSLLTDRARVEFVGRPLDVTIEGAFPGHTSVTQRLGGVWISASLAPSLAPASVPRVLKLVDRFGGFLSRAFGVAELDEVSTSQVAAFVRSTNSDGVWPSVATMRLRRSVVRSVFRVGRELGFVDGDPTVDVALPSRTNEAARLLTDLEVQRCRRVALEDLTSTRLAVPWALGEATARTGEIGHVIVDDLDLDRSRVWIHGSGNAEPRWGNLTAWGVGQLERHLRDRSSGSLAATLSQSATTNAESRRAHSSQAIRETLRRAGLLEDSAVRPASLTAWAGRKVLNGTGRIDEVARALGMRSLDGAARLIGWDWTAGATGLEEES
jgi:integrase